MATLCKAERLHNNNLIHQLHQSGFAYFLFPFLVKWLVLDESQSPKIAFMPAVSKRNFKKAVDRNRVKRLTREAYRVSKEFLLTSTKLNNKTVVILLLYNGKEILSFEEIKTKVELSLKQIEKLI
jgi:ribonuclease P protein component